MPVRKHSLSYFILLSLEKTIDGFVRINDFLTNPGYYVYWDGWEYPLDKSELSQAIKRLRERGLVAKEIINTDQVILKLTDLGKEALGFDSRFENRGLDCTHRIR